MFIVFEGIDGSGKTTIAHRVTELLNQKNIPTIYTREPGGTNSPISEDIRNLIFKYENITPISETFLFTASRIEHLKNVVAPAIAGNKVIICDRYYYSSMAYQGKAKKVGVKLVFHINKNGIKLNFPDFIEPNIVFFINTSPEIAKSRRNNGPLTHFDAKSLDFYKNVLTGYEEAFDLVSKTQNIVYIDGKESIEEISSKCMESIEQLINNDKKNN